MAEMHWNKKHSFVRAVWRCPESRAARENHVGSGVRKGRRIFGREDGFTLIELLVVVVILAVAAAIVVPMASSGATMQLRSAVNMLAADLEYAKSLSIGTGQYYSVEFDTTNDMYRILADDGTVIKHPVTKGDYIVQFRAGVIHGHRTGRLGQVTISAVSFDGESTVRFDYLGTPYRGGGELNNHGVITLNAGGVSRIVRVEPVTGFISILD
jgi:type II secretion system protein H